MLPKIFNWISVASFLMLCMVYIYFVNTYTINTPYLDDTSLIDFLFQVTQKDVTWSKFFQAFFRSDNDHCLAIPRLIILLDYWLNNSINYTHFIILINCLIFVILYFFYIEFKQIKVSFYYFLPVVLLWLQPQYYEVAFWGLTGMQHTILTIFVLLIIQLIYSQKKSHYIIAMIIGLLATFTHGNGILSYPTALFILLIQRRFRESIFWILAMFISLAFYLLTYKSGRDAHLNIDIFKISESFFAFIGANQSVFRMFVVKLSTIWGVFITGFLGYFIIKNLWFMTIKNKIQTHPHIIRLLALFCFIVFTSGIIALMRSWSGVPLASRYQSYAAISSIIVYLVALSYLKKEWRKYLGIFSLLTTFFFYINSYHFYTQAVDAKVKILTADSFNWKHHNTMFCVSQQFINNANQFIKPAYNQDLWKLSNPFLDIESSLLKPYVISSDSFDSTKYQINIEPYTEPIGIWFRYYLKIQNNDIPFTKKTGADALFLILKEEKSNQTYLIGTTSNVSTRREVISGSFFNYFKQGFTALAPLANIQEGNYRLGYLTINNKVKTIKFTNTFIPIRTPSLNMKSL